MSKSYPTGYRKPRKNVLLVSCMDLRLIDDIVRFMDHDNLTNRYDQFILAGAALGGVLKMVKKEKLNENVLIHDQKIPVKTFNGWQKSLLNHIDLAIQLHQVHDVYIIEHEHCGAYAAFLKDGDFEHHPDPKAEHEAHAHYSGKLSALISKHVAPIPWKMDIHCFMMDLGGNVSLLGTTAPTAH